MTPISQSVQEQRLSSVTFGGMGPAPDATPAIRSGNKQLKHIDDSVMLLASGQIPTAFDSVPTKTKPMMSMSRLSSLMIVLAPFRFALPGTADPWLQ